MKKRLNITEAIMKDQELLLMTEESTNLTELSPAGQMLVDSDQLSFIYLAEQDGDYTYITIPEKTWSVLKEGLAAGAMVSLSNGSSQVELVSFKEEMEYLIENIKGNSNYGDEMVGKVELIF
ncbi:hypothetical protein [Mesobacillus foraminis]|uniref:UPF0738 family protein n=1 Tax=Mesobacillus foraminis TaxID=279826 RepID=UPI000EF49A72|nr:hypothetical protein [Mesobacillus foraminis]